MVVPRFAEKFDRGQWNSYVFPKTVSVIFAVRYKYFKLLSGCPLVKGEASFDL